MISEAYELFGCNTADLFIMSVNTGDTDAECILFDETYGIEFPCISGVEGGGTAINNTYGIGAYPTYILIAPNHDIVEQDMWPISSTQTFVNYFESNGLVQAECGGLSANFIADVTDICEMDMVNYSDLSSGAITSWEWTFEGGNPATSTEQNPVVTYENQGTYDVELTVSDGTQSNTFLLEDYITVSTTPPTMLNPFSDVCEYWPEFELTGGSPAGGVYSGPGVANGMFDPAVAGLGTHTITYTYTASNGCDNFAEQTILVDPCTGVGELSEKGMRIYPNPTAGNFEVELYYSGNVTIQVMNVLGITVYEENTVANGKMVQSINLSTFEDGIYFVTIRTTEDTFVKKLKLNH
ncbi:MAG: T9SS type A sorting domain-containing protein [Bacteroidales bacterium]